MPDIFYLKLLLSFLVGGVWITLATFAAERFGSVVGGLIGGLPSTAVVAFLFIAWTQGPQQLFDVTTAFPLAFAPNAIFLIVYAILARKGLAVGIGGAFLVWALLETLIVISQARHYAVSMAVWALVLVAAYHILQNVIRVPSHAKVTIHYTVAQVIWRASFAGGMVAFAVVMGKSGGPLLGSVFSAFPALFMSTLIITARSAGIEFSRSLATPLMVSSEVNLVVFATALRYAILSVGPVAAIAIAYGISMGSAYLTYRFIKARLA